MSTFIKTGFWEKSAKPAKGWFNLTSYIESFLALIIETSTDSNLIPKKSTNAYQINNLSTSLVISNPSTDFNNFEGFIIRITDNGTSQAISFGSKYRPQGDALPTTTSSNLTLIIVSLYDAIDDKYDTKWSQEI